jgi:hypothetical protein
MKYDIGSYNELETLYPRLRPGDRVNLYGLQLYTIPYGTIYHVELSGDWLEIIDPPPLAPIPFLETHCASCNGSGSVPGPGGHYDVSCTACGGSGTARR